MPALPIVERELRLAARNRETYWGRSGVVLALGLLWIPGLLGTFGGTIEINTFVFNGMLWAGFGVSCVAFLFTADAISRERREGTLGLLFLSRVRAGDVLLGKIGSSGFKGLCMLAAFLPMLMIPVLAGGVTGGEAFREGLVLLDTFWFSLCAGLWASARSTDAFKSIKRASWLVGVVVFAPFLWNLGFHRALILDAFSPLATLFCARDGFYKGLTPWPYWISLAAIQLLGWALLLFAGIQLRHSLRKSDSAKVSRTTSCNPSKSSHEKLPSSALRRPSKRRIRFLHAYRNPVDWLVQRQRGILTTLWIAAAIEVLYFASSWAVLRGMVTLGWPSLIGWVTWFAASASTDALFARAGSRFFYESKRSDHLEILVTTPLGPRGVMEGQWSALKKLLAWPVAIALTVMLLDEDISLVTQIGQPGVYDFGWFTQCFVTWGIDIAGSILGILAVCWFGMLFALKGKSAAGIIVRAAGLGTGIPALFKTLYAFGTEHITFTVSSSGLWSGTITNWLEEIIVMMYYLWLFRFARKAVLRELSGIAPSRHKFSHVSRIMHHFSPQITHATDATV